MAPTFHSTVKLFARGSYEGNMKEIKGAQFAAEVGHLDRAIGTSISDFGDMQERARQSVGFSTIKSANRAQSTALPRRYMQEYGTEI